MKRVLLILNAYYPDVNANTLCVNEYILELRKRGYGVDILTVKTSLHLKEYEEIDGIRIYRYVNWYLLCNNFLSSALSTAKLGLLTPLFWFSIKFSKLLLKITEIDKLEPVEGHYDKKKCVDLGMSIINSKEHVAIIAFCISFAALQLGTNLKKEMCLNDNLIPLVICELDPFTNNRVFPKWKKDLRRQEEIQVFKSADQIIVTPEIFQSMKKMISPYKKKIVQLTFPLLNSKNGLGNTNSKNNTEYIECVYAGNFYRNIRSPEAMLQLFSMPQMQSARLHIYAGKCDNIIKKYKKKMGERLCLHEKVEKHILESILEQSDCIVNIGNSISNQTPSKILEIISFGKPIIHFYRIDKDSCLKYLRNYPLVFKVDERRLRKQADLVKRFLMEKRGKQVDFTIATKGIEKFRGENVVKEFCDIVDKVSRKKVY